MQPKLYISTSSNYPILVVMQIGGILVHRLFPVPALLFISAVPQWNGSAPSYDMFMRHDDLTSSYTLVF